MRVNVLQELCNPRTGEKLRQPPAEAPRPGERAEPGAVVTLGWAMVECLYAQVPGEDASKSVRRPRYNLAERVIVAERMTGILSLEHADAAMIQELAWKVFPTMVAGVVDGCLERGEPDVPEPAPVKADKADVPDQGPVGVPG